MEALLIVIGAIILIGLGYVVLQLRTVMRASVVASRLPAATVAGKVPAAPGIVSATLPEDTTRPPLTASTPELEERERALARSEAQFLERQASLAAFEGRLAEMAQAFAASQGEFEHRERQLAAREAAFAASEAAVADGDAAWAGGERQAIAAGDGSTVGPELAQLLAREAELADREAQLTDRAAALADRTAALADRAAAVVDHETAVAAREELLTERTDRLAARTDRLAHREDQLTHREDLAAKDATRLEERRAQLEAETRALVTATEELTAARSEHIRELERIAGLTAEDAARELTSRIEEQAKRAAAITVRDLEAEAKKEADRRAREITSQAIQRVASAQTSESVVSVIHLPGDDMKGRIIGREGRNIRTFETLTGVNVMIDDTPEAVSLSCFDPVRREVARVTLDALVTDGRIHPQRIEDAYEQAKAEVEAQIDVTGRDTLLEVGLDDAHPELVTLLGRLRYRTSYGQNVLRHLVETAHIASGMAAELGLGKDGIAVVKRAAFFHDIGKALTHEVEGSHALVGAEVAKRCGESEEVVHAIAAHHLEVAPQTVEAWLTIGSDSCSGGRPGARRESLEAYVDRLKRIEEIAYSRDGVERVFAMSAGRELRVMVLPEEVDDLGSQVLARDIAKQIEDELTYPGQIKVTVIRESRASETAH